MKFQVEYKSLEEREAKVKEQEAKGLRVLHEDFNYSLEGGEPYGTLTFTSHLIRNSEAEIDDLKARVEKLERAAGFL